MGRDFDLAGESFREFSFIYLLYICEFFFKCINAFVILFCIVNSSPNTNECKFLLNHVNPWFCVIFSSFLLFFHWIKMSCVRLSVITGKLSVKNFNCICKTFHAFISFFFFLELHSFHFICNIIKSLRLKSLRKSSSTAFGISVKQISIHGIRRDFNKHHQNLNTNYTESFA